MKFTLTIESDNAAMVDDPRRAIVKILSRVADKLVTDHDCGVVRDENGNKVGSFDLDCDDERGT
jgi:hypothetical protein